MTDLPPLPDSPVGHTSLDQWRVVGGEPIDQTTPVANWLRRPSKGPAPVYDENPREWDRYMSVLNKQAEQNEALRATVERLAKALKAAKIVIDPASCGFSCSNCGMEGVTFCACDAADHNAAIDTALRGGAA